MKTTKIGPFGLAVVTAWGLFAAATALHVCSSGQASAGDVVYALVVVPFRLAAHLAVTNPATLVLAAAGVVVLWIVFMVLRGGARWVARWDAKLGPVEARSNTRV